MPTVGSIQKISCSENGADFSWCLEEFEMEDLRRKKFLNSHNFYFLGWSWKLTLGWPDPLDINDPVSLHIWQLTERSPSKVPVRYWLGVQRAEGFQEEIGRGTKEPEKHSAQTYFWLRFKEMEKRIDRLTPSDSLTFIVRLRSGPETANEMGDLGKEPPISLENSNNEKAIQTDCEDNCILIENYRQYLLHADDHDVLLKVKGKEFKAHKSILRARSPVFEAMFKHKMKENIEDSITIEDIDPDCFDAFLMYIYTGEVENISAVNAMSLYFAGDKYDFPFLKRRCIYVLKTLLSTSLVCSIITMAMTHGGEELLESAMCYVTCHLEELMESTEWQQFLLSNPLQANEISLKALKRRKTSGIQDEVPTNNTTT